MRFKKIAMVFFAAWLSEPSPRTPRRPPDGQDSRYDGKPDYRRSQNCRTEQVMCEKHAGSELILHSTVLGGADHNDGNPD